MIIQSHLCLQERMQSLSSSKYDKLNGIMQKDRRCLDRPFFASACKCYNDATATARAAIMESAGLIGALLLTAVDWTDTSTINNLVAASKIIEPLGELETIASKVEFLPFRGQIRFLTNMVNLISAQASLVKARDALKSEDEKAVNRKPLTSS